jgi:DNA-binding transcriptional regulator GbsR (MarR family)
VLEPREKVIEDFGLYFEQYGLQRILGRIYGLLLITDEPVLGLDAMAEQLGISKASASTTARQLQAFTLIEKVSLPGDRRDYYRVYGNSPDAHVKYLRTSIEKSLEFSSLIERAAQLEDLTPESHNKLEQIAHLYEAFNATIAAFFDNYQFEPQDAAPQQKPSLKRVKR